MITFRLQIDMATPALTEGAMRNGKEVDAMREIRRMMHTLASNMTTQTAGTIRDADGNVCGGFSFEIS
jgi:hypothetical protein